MYTTGHGGGCSISGTSWDYATIKYDPNGNTAWLRRYNGPGNYWDYSFALTIDIFGNVYVTGMSYGSGTLTDYATIKYVQNDNGTVAGTVKSASSQQNLEGVLVEALQGGMVKGSAKTDGCGQYSIINLSPGTYDVKALKKGYQTQTIINQTIIPGGKIGVDFQLALLTRMIAGHVRDAVNQQYLEGVLVEAFQEDQIQGSDNTDVEGYYCIPDLSAGSYTVRAKKTGYETKAYNGVQVYEGQATTQDFQLNPSPKDTLVYDDFSDGNDDGWEKYSIENPPLQMEQTAAGQVNCSWQVQDGQYTCNASGRRNWCIAVGGASDWSDYIFKAGVIGIEGVDKILIVRFVDVENFYAINVRSDWGGLDEVTFNKMENGTFNADIASVSYPSVNGVSYDVRVHCEGSNFKIYVDDNEVLNYADSSNPFLQGKVGIACWTGDAERCNIGFDNVLVAYLPGSGMVSGTITKKRVNPEPLEGALVEVYNGQLIKSVMTSADGRYSMSLQAGTYTVYASKDGYWTAPLRLDTKG